MGGFWLKRAKNRLFIWSLHTFFVPLHRTLRTAADGIEIGKKSMKTTVNNTNDVKQMMMDAISKAESIINVCNKQIEYLTHPEIYGCCLSKCNSIVINKERMMTVTTDENHMTTYEFSPLYPTYFSPEAADRIISHDIYKDINGNRIPLERIGKLEYYRLLKARSEKNIEVLKSIAA